ncbi:MAG: hypothetical protein DCC68_13735 [Planctomycetota bacterium]|nr:MAG: hypothetical protein DCC68_13735 [Planctomycetota bacterium]
MKTSRTPPIRERSRPGSASAPHATRRGFILVIILVAVAMIGLGAFTFAELMLAENKAVRLHGDEVRLRNAAASAEAWIVDALERTPDERMHRGGLVDNEELFRAIAVGDSESKDDLLAFSVVSPTRSTTGGVLRFGLENESAKLNLVALLELDRRSPGVARQALLRLPRMTPAIADALLDWLDDDSSRREYGAEVDDYRDAAHGRSPRNGIPPCIEELMFVRGSSPELWYGVDADRNYIPDFPPEAEGPQIDGWRRGSEDLPWSSLLTLVGAERNATPEGEPRLFLNDPDLAKVHSKLLAALGRSVADFVVAYRQYGRISASAGNSVTDWRVDTSIPPRHNIEGVLDLVDAFVEVPLGANERGTLRSPLTTDPQSLRETLPRFLDFATTDARSAIPGRININEAPRDVLRALPSIGDALADQIAARQSAEPAESGADSPRRYATWLLVEGLMDLKQLKTLWPFITCGGDVYRGQIVAFMPSSAMDYRVEVAIDAASRPARRLTWKDLRPLGTGFAPDQIGFAESDTTRRERRGIHWRATHGTTTRM